TAKGDRAALRKLYDRLGGHALAVARRVLGSGVEAEEVVQEGFLDVWTRAALYDAARGRPRTWILAMARHRAIDRVGRRGAAARLAGGVLAESESELPGATPLERVEQREERARIQAALLALSPEQRQVLELAYFEGLSQTEIATRIDQPLG